MLQMALIAPLASLANRLGFGSAVDLRKGEVGGSSMENMSSPASTVTIPPAMGSRPRRSEQEMPDQVPGGWEKGGEDSVMEATHLSYDEFALTIV